MVVLKTRTIGLGVAAAAVIFSMLLVFQPQQQPGLPHDNTPDDTPVPPIPPVDPIAPPSLEIPRFLSIPTSTDSGELSITWSVPFDCIATRLHGWTSVNQNIVLVGEYANSKSGSKSINYDTAPVLSGIVYFTLSAVYSTSESEISAPASVMINIPTPPAPSASARLASGTVVIEWNQVFSEPASRHSTYIVYKITEVPGTPVSTWPRSEIEITALSTAWSDTSVTTGRYHYYVKAVNRLGVQGPASATVSITA